MRRFAMSLALTCSLVFAVWTATAAVALGQTLAKNDPVLQRIWTEAMENSQEARAEAQQAFRRRMRAAGSRTSAVYESMESAGAAGFISLNWGNRGWGTRRVFSASSERVPTIDLSLEDYGLIFRLAENGDNPLIRLDAQAQFGDYVPVFNTIAEIRGTEKPNEYVMLSAHFDSWAGGSRWSPWR